jgi:ribosomal protein L11 methyltransferase
VSDRERWWQVSVVITDDNVDQVAAAVVAVTGQGVEEPAPGQLTTVLDSAESADHLVFELRRAFGGIDARVTEIEPVNWVERWRDGIQTRRFGRLVVTPSWLPVEPQVSEVVVTIDPETAFGSGEHGSTRAAMTLLERHLEPGDRVLDFGSGSGILAIAAVLLGADAAVGIEVDEEANPVAEANARRNGVENRVTFLTGDAGQLYQLFGPVDLVCSNILRTINTLLLPPIRNALLPDGIAIFSGMEDAERELFLPVLTEAGWQVIDEARDAGWWSVAARRPS